METQVKPSEFQVEGGHGKSLPKQNLAARLPECVLRFLAMGLTLAAVVAMVVSNETETIGVPVVATLPPMPVKLDAKWNLLSAFVYFLVVNVIACCYTSLALIFTIASKGIKPRTLALVITLTDLLVVGLLLTGGGAAAAVGMIGKKGNSHVGWHKIAGIFPKFCKLVTASVVMSLLGASAYLLVVVEAIIDLHMRIQ